MKWVQLLCFSILLPCLIDGGLICYKNDPMEDDPVNTLRTIVCATTTPWCYYGVGTSSGKRIVARGCTYQRYCTKERSARYNGTDVTLTYTCCDVKLCNKAVKGLPSGENGLPSGENGLHLSMAVALVLGVVNVCMW